MEYRYPGSVEEAIQCLEYWEGRARVIAGGTDVLPDSRNGKLAPDCLVDITRVPGLDRIAIADDFVTVGAAATFTAIREDRFLKERVHALVEAAASIGGPPIQHVATWVGNIVQAMPAGDGAIVAVALEAEACIVDGQGSRWRPVETLFQGPGICAVDPTREIITAVRFPHPGSRMDGGSVGTAWQRVGRRAALVLPILNCAATVCLEEAAEQQSGRIRRVTLALGPVGPTPRRMREAESYLEGRVPTHERIAQAGRLAAKESSPRTSVLRASREYRLEIIPVLVSQALIAALSRAGRTDG